MNRAAEFVMGSVVFVVAGLASPALAQSDPSTFLHVYNIGTVPPGSPFAIPGAVTGSTIGGGFFRVMVSPENLSGNVLGPESQLNLFADGAILPIFNAGMTGAPNTNIEVNIFGGTIGHSFMSFAGSKINIFDGVITSRPEFIGSTVNVFSGSVDTIAAISQGSIFTLSGGSVSSIDAKSGSVVNITGGNVRTSAKASSSMFNISGGRVPAFFDAYASSIVNMSGGSIGGGFNAHSRSTVNITGGNIGDKFDAHSGSDVRISGGSFLLNGAPVSSLSTGLGTTGTLTGILQDGSVVIFSGLLSDTFANDTTTLLQTGFAPSENPGVLSNGQFNKGVRPGESLTVNGDGSLGESFQVHSGTLNIEGGSVGNGLEVVSGEVNISGGTVGSLFSALAGSTVNVSGGTFGILSRALLGSTFNISGGSVGGIIASSGSTLSITGGNITRVSALSGSDVSFSGDHFQLSGTPASDITGGLGTRGMFSGILEDGTVFVFTSEQLTRDSPSAIAPGSATLLINEIAASENPGVLSSGVFAKGVRPGETLTVNGDGALSNNFAVMSGTLNIESGTVGDGLDVSFGQVNISGGTVGDDFTVFPGSTVNISGGTIGDDFTVLANTMVNISGGIIGSHLRVFSGSTVNYSGGGINLNGVYPPTLLVSFGSTFNIFGTEFFIDGVPVSGLVLNQPVEIFAQESVLSGTLADGRSFTFDMVTPGFPFYQPPLVAIGTLTLTLVSPPGPAGCTVADVADADGLTVAGGGGPDGILDVSDLFAYLSAFDFQVLSVADIADGFGQNIENGAGPDGNLDVSDLFAFLDDFAAFNPDCD